MKSRLLCWNRECELLNFTDITLRQTDFSRCCIAPAFSEDWPRLVSILLCDLLLGSHEGFYSLTKVYNSSLLLARCNDTDIATSIPAAASTFAAFELTRGRHCRSHLATVVTRSLIDSYILQNGYKSSLVYNKFPTEPGDSRSTHVSFLCGTP